MTPLRRAGSPWRVLAHEWAGRGAPTLYGDSYAVDNADTGTTGWQHAGHKWTAHAPGTEFDELVVGRWLHVEMLDTGRWYMHIGGVRVEVTADRDGRPTSVEVYGPGDYLEPVEGCAYDYTWTAEPDGAE